MKIEHTSINNIRSGFANSDQTGSSQTHGLEFAIVRTDPAIENRKNLVDSPQINSFSPLSIARQFDFFDFQLQITYYVDQSEDDLA